MKISSKPTTYIIDGLNFVRSYIMGYNTSEEDVTQEFLKWIFEIADYPPFDQSSFRIIFDGSFRGSGPIVKGNVKVTYTEDVSADELIAEQAIYLHGKEERVCVVTSDLSLKNELASEGVKTMFCDGFFQGVKEKTRREK